MKETDPEAANAKLSYARHLAQSLKKNDYRDPVYPWAAEYILGMTAFREALAKEEAFQEQLFFLAIDDLRKAEERGVPPKVEDYRKNWAYAFAVSLCRVGLAKEAQPILLDEIIRMQNVIFDKADPELIEAKLLRSDYQLSVKTPDSLVEAEQYNEEAFVENERKARPDQIENEQVRARLQRVQIKLALRKGEEAKEAPLSETPEARFPNEETISLPFAALYSARNYEGLKSQINYALMEKDVDDSEAEGCMKIFLIMSRRLGLMVAQRDELLQFIMDHSSDKDKLYQLAADAQIQEGAPPKSAHNLGRGLNMS